MNQQAGNYLLQLSARVYSALLILYPTDYRCEYGYWMVQVFRDVCRDTFQQQGTAGIMIWWLSTLFDLVITSIEQRRKVGFKMSKSQFAHFTSIFFIISGICMAIASISNLQPTDHYTYEGIYQLTIMFIGPAFLFAGLGNFGLWARYGAKASSVGQLALIIAGLSGFIILGAMLALNANEYWWLLVVVGIFGYTISSIIVGLIQLTSGFMQTPRWLPLLNGVLPLIMATGVSGIPNTGHVEWGTFVITLGMGLCGIAIGYSLSRQPVPTLSGAAA